MAGKLIGIVVLLTGAIGFSAEICTGRRERIRFLKEIREMFCLIQGEIEYTVLPLPEIFKNLSGKLREPLSEALLEMGNKLTMEQGETMGGLWQSCMGKAVSSFGLSAGQREILFSFPDGFTGSEYREQARGIERYIREMDQEIQRCEKELRSRNRIIMSLGIAAGLFLVIVLL